MFDLSADPRAIDMALSSDPLLRPLVLNRPGLRVPGAWNGFEVAIRAVLGQQITVKAAIQMAGRIVSIAGAPLMDNRFVPGLTHAFPRPEHFHAHTLANIGMPKSRAAALVSVAAAVKADPHLFDPRRNLEEAVSRLRKLPGIGEWTAQYIAMRALGESDAFLAGDVALQRKFAMQGPHPTASELLAHAERWRPWRAYAVIHLWMADPENPQTSSRKETNHELAA
jgi:AraC family transcriptional regulator of adaptative response / DNA-3-methyladenine glycosylase II